jgi:hypothetical protein
MPKNAPSKSTLKAPPPEYDSKGLITNWSQLWSDAKDLETLVTSERLDGKKPAAVREDHPQFRKYTYRAFSSALANIRKKHNKEAEIKEEYMRYNGECESYCLSYLFNHISF